MKGITGIAGAVLMFSQIAFGGPRAGLNIDVAVLDARNQALSGVLIQLKAGHAMVAQAETDALGHVHFTDLKPGYYEIAAGKQGYVARAMTIALSQTAPPL